MNREPMDTQEAFDKLVQAQYELQEAFYGFAGWAARSIADNRNLPYAEVAENFRTLAKLTGYRCRALAGENGRDNPHLEGLAKLFDNLAQGKSPPPFGVIEGGKENEQGERDADRGAPK